MAEDYDAVVVGSGFGGSVMAYRLAKAGMRVCVMERGKPHPPGTFARSPHRFRRQFWDPSEGLYGLFNIWSFRRIGAIVASGLGGGSLIYANVLLRKDPKWFVQQDTSRPGAEFWPVTREELDPHYDDVERMLGAQRYPLEHAPYRDTPRTIAFMEAAERAGWDPFLPKLAVTFGNPGETPAPGVPLSEPADRNLHNVPRQTCRLVGECDIGCNFGAKNTLDLNYLSEVARLGGDIRTLTEVRRFGPRDDGRPGWWVEHVTHDADCEGQPRDTRSMPLQRVTARRLILAAGTFGTTHLLFQNKARLPGLSAQLGQRFSGNGDLLTLAVKPTFRSGTRSMPRVIDGAYGPSITAAVKFPDRVEGGRGRGFYLEDAGYPEFLNWMMQVAESPGALWRWRHIALRLVLGWLRRDRETDMGAEMAALLGTADLSSGMLPLLGMGRDVADGVLLMRGERLDLDFEMKTSKRYFDRVRSEMRRFAKALGAQHWDNPIWHFGRRVVTVHPLGGCPMGRHPGEGVVDAHGRVFDVPWLYVADGSVMPGAVGPNPSLTIAALADRFATRLIEDARSDAPWPTLTVS